MRGVPSNPLPVFTDSPENRPREIPEMTDNDHLTEENDTLTKYFIPPWTIEIFQFKRGTTTRLVTDLTTRSKGEKNFEFIVVGKLHP